MKKNRISGMVRNKESPPFDKVTKMKYCRAYLTKKYQLRGKDLSKLTEDEVQKFLERVDHLTTVRPLHFSSH